jgi:hypothetical protein
MPQPPRDHRLFYYTRSFDVLRSTLQDGFWPRYCEEDFSALFRQHLGENFWFAFPMVCFTDMPPKAAASHQDRYGYYAIALNKDAASRHGLQPIIYLQEDSPVARHVAATVRPGGDRLQVKPGQNNPFRPLLPYIKMTPGTQTDRGPGRAGAWEGLAFEDEMEWRYVCADHDLPWPEHNWRGFVKAEHHEQTKNRRLVVDPLLIDTIVVTALAEARAIAAQFPAHVGKIYLRTNNGALRNVGKKLLAGNAGRRAREK